MRKRALKKNSSKTPITRLQKLFAAALAARCQAYAPYSKWLCGSAILTDSGRIYAGCNIESVDYNCTHAEEAALAAMVMAGERTPVRLVVFGGLEDQEPSFSVPCGKCRQKLVEFASLSGHDLEIILGWSKQGQLRTRHISDLLPLPFGPADVKIDLTKYRKCRR